MTDSSQPPSSGRQPVAGISPEILGHVVGGLGEGVVLGDASGRIRYANANALEIWGFASPAEVPASIEELEPLFDVRTMDGEPLPSERWALARALRGERFDGFQCRFRRRDGGERIVRCAGGPVALDGDEPGAWVSFHDVSEQESVVRDLREERDLSAALVDHSSLAIALLRAPGLELELVNHVFAAMRPEAEMVGRTVEEVFPEAGPAGFVATLRQVAATGETIAASDTPVDFLGPAVRYFSFTFSRLPQPPGRPTRVLLMARETTAEVLARTRAEAIASERARDLARARVTSARLRSLVDLAAAIASVEDLDRLLDLVTGEATRLLGADTASLFLRDERDTLIGRAAVGMPEDELVGMRIELPGWPEVAEVMRTGSPAVHVRAEEVDGPEQPYIRRYGIRSYVAVRLGTSERPLGVLFVNHTGRRHRFTRPELAFVETLTSYLSVTIERARLVGSLREAVTSLQDALLPASFPGVRGVDVGALYRSASEVAQVGGDFYDLFPLGGELVAVIGDVCGKGVAAARHTARLRFELRALLEADGDPGRVLEAFNAKVFEEFAADEFATLLVLVLDPATGEARWSSAGHPPPVVGGPDPRALEFEGSLPVGLFPEAAHVTHRLVLPSGQCIVLYTDGVVEARAAGGQEFGQDGLLAALPPGRADAAWVAELILKEVQRHTGGELDDDAAVVVLARE
jgi:serine phosphatase RsbU (regulator of sigma subunit)/PAS domain-containing protein